mmetsp:Transcript_4724/g.9961  ORF Transcript_4724/g.9961 Transcript_4724/m.9961 type:complete len:211 (-) Transcript_4724:333-965(-)
MAPCQRECLPFHQITQTTGRGNHHLRRRGAQLFRLGLDVGAPVDACGREADGGSVRRGHAVDLDGQFARRGNHQTQRRGGRGRPRRGRSPGQVADGDAVEHREQKAQRFAGPGFGHGDEVLPQERHRPRAGLDRARVEEAFGGKHGVDGRGERCVAKRGPRDVRRSCWWRRCGLFQGRGCAFLLFFLLVCHRVTARVSDTLPLRSERQRN